MRHDENIYKYIEKDRISENDTACCIYNDKTGCFQASQSQCPVCMKFVFINGAKIWQLRRGSPRKCFGTVDYPAPYKHKMR